MINNYCFFRKTQKNIKKINVDFIKKESSVFYQRFGGAFEHILSNFCLNMYLEKNIEIPLEKRESIFFMNFIENWNKHKENWSDLEALSYYDLTKEEQEQISNQINKKDHTEIQRNKKNKSVGNGEGLPYYSETLGCWVYQYYDTSHKRQTMKQRKKETVKEFKTRVTEVKNSLNNGTYISKSTETVKSIIEKHIKQKFEDGITKGTSYKRDTDTLHTLEKCCSNFINKPIQQVKLQDIQISKNTMKKYSQSVIDKMWRLLKKAFSIASSPSIKLILFNIMIDENLTKPISEIKTKKVYPLSNEERQKLLTILDNEERNHKYRNIVKMQLISAMRIGEVLARSKNDYDEDTNKFDVHNTLTKDENGNVILGKYTKTYNEKTGIDEGQRYLPLNAPIFNELHDIIQEQLNTKITNIHNLIFWDYEKETFISYTEINSWLSRMNEKYSICNDTLHTHKLRHTAITYWKQLGIPLDVIQYLAGHVEGSDITEDVYIETPYEYVDKTLQKIS